MYAYIELPSTDAYAVVTEALNFLVAFEAKMPAKANANVPTAINTLVFFIKMCFEI